MSAKILRVTAPHFVAGAVFRENPCGQLVCFTSAPILHWMVGQNYAALQARIDRNPRWKAEWLPGTQVDANLMQVELPLEERE